MLWDRPVLGESHPEHQSLLEKVQAEAEHMRAQKMQEYFKKCAEHAELSRRRAATTYNKEWNKYRRRSECKSTCRACRLRQQISQLKISVFEWPLPNDLTMSKAIVFEISVPKLVVVWRDLTTYLFLHVLRDGQGIIPNGWSKLWFATHHSGLSPFSTRWSKICVASATKPVEASHYRDMHITRATEANLLVWHPWFHYDYYEQDVLATSTNIFSQTGLPKWSS